MIYAPYFNTINAVLKNKILVMAIDPVMTFCTHFPKWKINV